MYLVASFYVQRNMSHCTWCRCPLHQELLLAFASLTGQDSSCPVKSVIQGCDDAMICAMFGHPVNESFVVVQVHRWLSFFCFDCVSICSSSRHACALVCSVNIYHIWWIPCAVRVDLHAVQNVSISIHPHFLLSMFCVFAHFIVLICLTSGCVMCCFFGASPCVRSAITHVDLEQAQC